MVNKKRIVKRVIAMALVVSTMAGVTINHVKAKAADGVKKENSIETVITISKFEDWTELDWENVEDINFDEVDINWDSLESELNDVLKEIEIKETKKINIEEKNVTPTFAKYCDQLDTMTVEELDAIFNTPEYNSEFNMIYGINTRGNNWLKALDKIEIGDNLARVIEKLLDKMEKNPKLFLVGLPIAITVSVVAIILAKKIPDVLSEKIKAEAGNEWMKKLAEAYIKSIGDKDKLAKNLKEHFSDDVIKLIMEWISGGGADISKEDLDDLKDEIENDEDLEEPVVDEDESEEPTQDENEDLEEPVEEDNDDIQPLDEAA